jgi:hypothetical protein
MEPEIILFIRDGQVIGMYGIGKEAPPVAVIFLPSDPNRDADISLEDLDMFTYTQDGTVNSASEIQL